MAHTRDLNAAREAVTEVEDPYDKASVLAEVATASALTDVAAALEDLMREFRDKRFTNS